MINLRCPSCGANLELSDHMGMAHCEYCGTKIFLHDEDSNDGRRYQNYLELLDAAVEAQNYQEIIYYSNKALEIDSTNPELWIKKALAVCNLSTEEKQRYDEAKEYLEKAEEIIGENEQIIEISDKIKKMQSRWLNNLGVEKYEIAITKSPNLTMYNQGTSDVKKMFTEVMDYLLAASYLAPMDIEILENIECLRNQYYWIFSNDHRVKEKLSFLDRIRENEHSESLINKYQQTISMKKKELAALQEKEHLGVFRGVKRVILDVKVKQVLATIEMFQEEIEYLSDKLHPLS